MNKFKCSSDKTFRLAIIGICFLLYISWSVIIPFNHAPDESMRYDIPEFIYQYGHLPAGDDERIRNEIWGFSYAFTPVLSYMVSALFMKIAGIFAAGEAALLGAARLVSVCFSLGTVYFCTKIGSLLFEELYAGLFVISVAFLPQFVFISSYVNTDALGIFTVSWVIYAMLRARAEKWRFRDCIFLGVGLGLCLLSYYNCYGIIPAAGIYSVVSVLGDEEIDDKPRFILVRILWVLLAAALVSGWWFLRNAMLYDGDLLGLRAQRACQELYAQEAYKPSNKETLQSMGVSLRDMLFRMRWLSLSLQSFIGVFDYLNLFLRESCYRAMSLLFALGLSGWAVHIGVLRGKKREYHSLLLHGVMVLMCAITIALSLYYSYTCDFQAQGRYLLPMLIPLNILLVYGWQQLADRLLRGKRTYAAIVLIAIYVAMVYSATVETIIPAYC